MFNKMNKVLKDQEFWIWKKKWWRKEPKCQNQAQTSPDPFSFLFLSFLFPLGPNIFFLSFLCTSIVHLCRPSSFLPASFFVLSLHREDKYSFPTKIKCRVGGYKREDVAVIEEEEGHILTFLFLFSVIFSLQNSMSLSWNFMCNVGSGSGTWCYW